ncbi:MAG: hypothetical protein ABFD69_03440 [Candidatus Sumerlaeia bacterium]
MTPPADHMPDDPARTGDSDAGAPAPEQAPEPLARLGAAIGIIILAFVISFFSIICMALLPFLILILFIPASLIFVAWVVLSMTLGREYLQHLRDLGYAWLEISDANIILYKCGRKAYLLPQAIDYEMLPRSRKTRAGLIRFINHLDRYKRRVRRRSAKP